MERPQFAGLKALDKFLEEIKSRQKEFEATYKHKLLEDEIGNATRSLKSELNDAFAKLAKGPPDQW